MLIMQTKINVVWQLKPLACLFHQFHWSSLRERKREPTLLFEKSRGSFPLGGVVYLSCIIHIYHGVM